MASSMVAEKFSVQHLEVLGPPLPRSGGRLVTTAGEMAQIISDETIRHLVYLEFLPGGKPRGNHYHIKMQMHGVYVIKGSLEVILIDLSDQSKTTIHIQTGDLIRIRPRCAHVFIAKEYTQAIELNDTAYNSADTIPYSIETGSENGRV